MRYGTPVLAREVLLVVLMAGMVWSAMAEGSSRRRGRGGRPGRTAVFFVEPSMGMAAVYLQAVEMESSFVSVMDDESLNLGEEWENVDPTGVIAPVGRMTGYRGSGLELAVTSGIKISGLEMGLNVSWIQASLDGYSQRYRYMPELMRASGRSLRDSGRMPMVRVLGAVQYGIPIRRMRLGFQTRLGALIAGKTPLVIGRAMEENHAFTVDFGLDASLRANKWVSFGVLGYAGAFAFPGQYEGALGLLTGVNGRVRFYF